MVERCRLYQKAERVPVRKDSIRLPSKYLKFHQTALQYNESESNLVSVAVVLDPFEFKRWLPDRWDASTERRETMRLAVTLLAVTQLAFFEKRPNSHRN